jgi:predicted lysophospholipase L1 biosynthesis ABC-type transport system permease subunit
MAERLWPGENPLGRCIRFGWGPVRTDTMPCRSVVGVAENAVHDPAADLPMRYYLPDARLDFGSRTLVLRTRGDPALAAEPVRRAVQAIMPGQALVSTRVVRDLVDAKRRSWTVGAALFAAFGVLALLVASIGLYAVIAYNVGQRMHEMGVRTALGARPSDIIRLVMAQGVLYAVAGVLTGSAAALLASRWVQPLLFDQSARDPFVFLAVAAVLVGVAALASGVPALRASRANPAVVLRSD